MQNLYEKIRYDKIQCPECDVIQTAKCKINNYTWGEYIHECEKCCFLIMESEREKIREATPSEILKFKFYNFIYPENVHQKFELFLVLMGIVLGTIITLK